MGRNVQNGESVREEKEGEREEEEAEVVGKEGD